MVSDLSGLWTSFPKYFLFTMERLDLATYAKDIKANYASVVNGEQSYAIFTTGKDSALKPTAVGDGDLTDFVSEFEEGAVQFGVMAINPFGSDVKKLVLLGWCPDSAPLKSKVSYASNLSEVGKVMHYHVDITARDSDDLDVDDIMKKVSTASGARYSIQSLGPEKKIGNGFKPKPKSASPAPEPIASKPLPPKKPIATPIKPTPVPPAKKEANDDDDEWNGEQESEIRDFEKKPLETLPGSYKPVKVDINALKNEVPVKTVPLSGLTSMPKHKPSGEVLSRFNQPEVVKAEFGTNVPNFDNTKANKDSSKLVGGMSKNFGANDGLTPAQQWAAKKGKFTAVPKNETPVNSQTDDVDQTSDLNVNSAKSKFEKLSLESQEVETQHSAVFPPPVKEQASSVFPPPPARSTPAAAPAPVTNEWDDEEEEQKQESEQEVEEKPAALPARSLPPPPSETSSASAPEPTPAPLPERPTTATEKKEESLPSAIAEYEYEKDEDNEIGFAEGELIIDIKFVDDDWWMGTNSQGESGLFPASYVTIKETVEVSIEEEPATPAASEPKSEGLTAIAEYDYEATEDNELTFPEGATITNIEKVDEDWWLGEYQGEKKLFPANYVTLQ